MSRVLAAGLFVFVCMGQMCVDAPMANEELAASPEAADLAGSNAATDDSSHPSPEASQNPSGLADASAQAGPVELPTGLESNPTADQQGSDSSSEEPVPVPDVKTSPSPVVKPQNVPQIQLKPIARWNLPPNQRVNADAALNVGVVAFSKYGISSVRFIVQGQGYTGPSPIDVTEMTLNEQSGTYEYWTAINGRDFTSDGPITVEAEVYGNDGGLRDKKTDGGGLGLDAMTLVVNPNGTLPQVEAYVSPGADDGAGAVNDPARPYGTIGRAIDAIRQYRAGQGLGDNADGGIVRLTPGEHWCNGGGVGGPIACDNEWVTITTAPGGNVDNTKLLPGGVTSTRKLAVRGITLQGSGILGMSYNERMQNALWVDDCNLIGAGRGNPSAHPLSPEWGALYYTEDTITEVHQATSGAKFCRNLSIHRISDDAFQNIPMVVNCVVDDMDPVGTGAHADVWQHGGGNDWNRVDDNVIVYNLIATNLKYQSIFIRADIGSPPTMAQGMAFVNVYTHMLPDSHGWAGWGRMVDHLLWWHCTFDGKGMGFMSESYAGGAKIPCKVTNMSVKGCDFAFFGDGGAEIDWNNDWDSNHFVDGSVTAGVNVTTGDHMLDADSVPSNGSPLVDRLDAIVPGDANNNPRQTRSDIGAFEK